MPTVYAICAEKVSARMTFWEKQTNNRVATATYVPQPTLGQQGTAVL